MSLDGSSLDRALSALGELLEARGTTYRLAAVGGGAMLLLDLISRPTKDLDLVGQIEAGDVTGIDPLPVPLKEAIADVARALGLPSDWLNPGPASLLDLGLPAGFVERGHTRRYGGLEIVLADRFDQIHLKLYASADQGPLSKHFADLKTLEPTRDELLTAARWARTHDPSEGFAGDLAKSLEALGIGDPDELI
jgi:hypothetical protein